MDSHDVMRALRDHARTLGWEIQEWNWKDTDETGSAEYQMWIAPLDGTCRCESYDCTGECCGQGNCTCTAPVETEGDPTP